jgi:hypothetical protein
MLLAIKDEPDAFLQLVQWQMVVVKGAPKSANLIAPQRQDPLTSGEVPILDVSVESRILTKC